MITDFSLSYINFTDLTQMVTEFTDVAKSFGNTELNNLAKKIPQVLKSIISENILNHIQWVLKDGPSGAKNLN